MGGSSDLALKVVLQAQDAASGKLQGFGATLVNLAGKAGPLLGAMLAISAAVIAFGAASVQMAADYQQQMNKVQALTGANQQQMAYYDTSVKQLAMDAGVAPKALADGLYNVLSASYSGATAMKVLTLATQDAKIGMTDSATTTNALTNILRTFGTQSKDITRVNGEMLETVTLGKATFAQYATTITKAASSSKQFGVSMETMNAAWSTLTSTGISAGQATTDYTQLLGVMYGNIGTVTASLHKNGIAFNETKFNAMSFGDKVQYLNSVLEIANQKHVHITGVTKQAAQAIQAISSHIGDYSNNLKTLSNNQAMSQKTAQAWATTQSGFNQQLSRAQAAVQVLMIDIGQQLLPVLTRLVGAVAPAVMWLINFASAVSKNEVAMAFIKGALVGFVYVILAMLIPAFIAWATVAGAAALATLLTVAPILLVGAIVAVVVAGIILAIQHWGQIVVWLKMVWAGLVAWFHGFWNGVVGVFQMALKVLFFLLFGQFIAIVALFSWLYQHNVYFKQLVDAIVGFFKSGLTWLQGAWTTAAAWLVGAWNQLASFASKAWSAVSTVFSSIWSQYISGPLGNLWNQLTRWFSNLADQFLQSGKNFINMLVSGIASGAGAIWNAVTNIAGTIWKALGFHSPAKAGPGADADKWMPNLVSMLSAGLIAGAPLMQKAAYQVAAPLMMLNPASGQGGYGAIPYGRPPAGNSYNSSSIGGNHYYGPVTVVAQGASAKEVAKEVLALQSNKLRRSGNIGNSALGVRNS